MERRTTDLAVGGTIGLILVSGLLAAWRATTPATTGRGTMMDGTMSTAMMDTGPSPAYIVFLTAIAVAVLGVGYLIVRETVIEADGADRPAPAASEDSADRDDRDSGSGEVPDVLAALPEDERRILEPILDSPGLTQIEVRDRADFSKSKVSQTVTDLEKRGLVSRERQGRTYRIYPTDRLRGSD